jgi:arylsulfatase A-like enzyme
MPNRPKQTQWRWLFAAAITGSAGLAILLLVLFGRDEPKADPRPVGSAADILALRERDDLNVLFILIDTLRADRMGMYGYGRDTSPRLDALAASGVRFDRHLAQSSWTKCSMASLWTGLYPARTGVTRFDDMLPEQAKLPAELLREAGFQTVGLFRNGWVSPNFGFDQGFDVYSRPAGGPTPADVVRDNPTVKLGGTDEGTFRTAIEFLRVNGHDRWFLYLHLMDVHEYTYDSDSALFGGGYSDVYDNAIRFTDNLHGTFFDYLGDQGYLDDTLIVIASDHGEAFRERGIEGHARRIFRETTEVPLVMSFPFRLEPGVVLSQRTRNIDVWPTILDLIGIEPPADIDGRSHVPDIVAAASGDPPTSPPLMGIAHLDIHWGQNHMDPLPSVAVTEGSYRYVLSQERGQKIERLFDSARDPSELSDLAATEPETLARLREVGAVYLEAKPPWGDAPKREIGEMELNQLRALGYALP